MNKLFIIISGVYIFLWGLFSLIGTAGMFFGSAQVEALSSGKRILFSLLYLAMSGWLLATAVGLFRRKNWARISIFYLSGLALSAGTPLLLMMLLGPHLFDSGEGAKNVTFFATVIVSVFFVFIPSVLIFFFRRRSVKKLFMGEEEMAKEGSRKIPAGIKVIAIINLFSVVGLFAGFMFPQDVEYPILFNTLWISGIGAKMYHLAASVISVYIGFGFLKLKRLAWKVAIAYYGVTLVLFATNMFTTTQEVVDRMTKHASAGSHQMTVESYLGFQGISLGIFLLALFYIYKKKEVFTE